VYSTEILEDLFFVKRGWLNANHFVYTGEKPVLIDTAYKTDVQVTLDLIEKLGVHPSAVSLIVNTHTHCDHVGANRLIQKQSDCDIALHSVGKHFMETRDDWATWWRYYHQEANFFQCTQSLEDGNVLKIGPHEFQVIYTPGHASDGIVLYSSREKLLISSDTLWENDMAVITQRVEGSLALLAMRQSLEKLGALNVNRVFPGHGDPFEDMKSALAKALEKIDLYLKDRKTVGKDLIKKIIVYTLLMKKSVKEQELFPLLMKTTWFRETVDFYFDGDYETIYQQIMNVFARNKVIRVGNGSIFTTVEP